MPSCICNTWKCSFIFVFILLREAIDYIFSQNKIEFYPWLTACSMSSLCLAFLRCVTTIEHLHTFQFSIIILMIIENRALWLARGFASSRYNHGPVIITMKISSFQNGSKICWCFQKLINNFIFLNNHQCNHTKTILVASGNVNISPYSLIFTSPSATNC